MRRLQLRLDLLDAVLIMERPFADEVTSSKLSVVSTLGDVVRRPHGVSGCEGSDVGPGLRTFCPEFIE